MKELILKSILTKKLKKSAVLSICKLKNTHWKYGIKSQLKWFNECIEDNDIHNLAYIKKKLVGYVLLRNRNFLLKKKKFNYLYFDTLIVSKRYRKKKIAYKLAGLTAKVIKKSKLHSMLICEKKTEIFYKKNKWEKMTKKNFKILDHNFSKKLLMMSFNLKKTRTKNNIKYYIFN
tara:strand:- start:93 stop:617 length:525 start_codon:yes stop_codon:yes gene_type:complete